MFATRVLFGALVTAPSCLAHIALWDKGMFGLNYPGQANDTYQYYNNNVPVAPLRGFDHLTTEEWFGHGMKGYPPKEGDFMELEAGGSFLTELSCNRAWTTLRNPADSKKQLDQFACPAIGPLHTANRFDKDLDQTYLSGTALAIAYTSDVTSLRPSDMTVISVNYTSVWTREVVYPIPSGLPPCPAGGCLCTWNWIHQSGHGEGYGEEIYNVLYRCNVTGATNPSNVLPVGGGQVPVHCPHAPGNCTVGPKQGIYVFQADGNNMDIPPVAPSYNAQYGFADGAQLDLFNVSTTAVNKTANGPDDSHLNAEDPESSTTPASSLPSSTATVAVSNANTTTTPVSAKFGPRFLASHQGQQEPSSDKGDALEQGKEESAVHLERRTLKRYRQR